MKKSNSRNHHYISQVEQRLNAIDKTVKPENQRIYKFSVLSHAPAQIKNNDATGVKIEKNLSRKDLYALKTLDEGGQHNLEDAFSAYEDGISKITNSLLKKIEDPAAVNFENELLRLYCLKLINVIRNPHCIKRTLEMFRELHGVLPGNEVLKAHFISLDGANRPQVARICSEFNISKDEYLSWLKLIYLLILQPLDQGLNLIEHLIKSVFDNKNISKDFHIYQYKDDYQDAGVLICDRGLIDQQHIEGAQLQMFNLDANTFVTVLFVDIINQKIIPMPPEFSELNFGQANVAKISIKKNDLASLERYNNLCVAVAHSNVYCSSANPYGVVV